MKEFSRILFVFLYESLYKSWHLKTFYVIIKISLVTANSVLLDVTIPTDLIAAESNEEWNLEDAIFETSPCPLPELKASQTRSVP